MCGVMVSTSVLPACACHQCWSAGFFFFFSLPQLYLWGSPFWVSFLRIWPFSNPTIEVVTCHLHGWCMLGVFLLLAFTRLGHERQDLWSLCDGRFESWWFSGPGMLHFLEVIIVGFLQILWFLSLFHQLMVLATAVSTLKIDRRAISSHHVHDMLHVTCTPLNLSHTSGRYLKNLKLCLSVPLL